LPSPFFPDRFQPITAAAMCTVAINFLELLMLNLSISYPYFIKFHDFADNSQEGMKHQMWGAGCNSDSVPTGPDFPDNSNIYFLFFTMRTGPFSKCENRSGSQIGCQVRAWAVVTSSDNLQSGFFDS
jgi:hypothetical protein